MVRAHFIGRRTKTADGKEYADFEFTGSYAEEKPIIFEGIYVRDGSTFVYTDSGHAGGLSVFNEAEQQWNEVE